MFNIIIFLIGAGIMFYMAWRSWSRRRKLMTRGEKVEAAVAGTVQSRDGKAYLLEFTTAGGTHRLHYPKSAKGRELAQGAVVTLYYNPDDPAEMYVEGDQVRPGCRGAVCGAGRRAAGSDGRHRPLRGGEENETRTFWHGRTR